MILESYFWKRELAREAGMIERWCAKPPSDRQAVLLERKTFLSAYAVRKLKESNKLTDDLVASTVPAVEYPKKLERTPRFRHLDDINDRYDLDVGKSCELKVADLVNTIIHSLYFNLSAAEDGRSVDGFYVTSDHRDKKLWFVLYSEFWKLLQSVSDNYPSYIKVWVDENGKEKRIQT